jgi:hypothetical protein
VGWETRRGKPVYYRKVREGARVRSVYCGPGERGERAAREDAQRRALAKGPGAPCESAARPEEQAAPAATESAPAAEPEALVEQVTGVEPAPRPRGVEAWRALQAKTAKTGACATPREPAGFPARLSGIEGWRRSPGTRKA